TLFKHDGTTQIINGDSILVADAANVGGFGLKFTPAANFNGNATFDVQAAKDGSGGGLSGATQVTISVTEVADPPSVTQAITSEDTQSSSGLVITKNASDGASVAFFKITNITNGTLFKNNGSTQITSGTVISETDANAGLKFTPSANLYSNVSTFSFQVQG